MVRLLLVHECKKGGRGVGCCDQGDGIAEQCMGIRGKCVKAQLAQCSVLGGFRV